MHSGRQETYVNQTWKRGNLLLYLKSNNSVNSCSNFQQSIFREYFKQTFFPVLIRIRRYGERKYNV